MSKVYKSRAKVLTLTLSPVKDPIQQDRIVLDTSRPTFESFNTVCTDLYLYNYYDLSCLYHDLWNTRFWSLSCWLGIHDSRLSQDEFHFADVLWGILRCCRSPLVGSLSKPSESHCRSLAPGGLPKLAAGIPKLATSHPRAVGSQDSVGSNKASTEQVGVPKGLTGKNKVPGDTLLGSWIWVLTE